MKVAIVIGHTKKDKGAYSEHLKISEWDLFKQVIEKDLLLDVDMFLHDPEISSYTKRQELTAKNTQFYDLVFECHFNAANTKAQGCEALYYHGSKSGKNIATKFVEIWSKETGIKNRGAKPLNVGDNGYGFVMKTKGTAVLLEPFFGDNANDCDKWNADVFVKVIKQLIYE